MPTRIADTGGPTVTLMGDDGQVVDVIREVADRIAPEDVGGLIPPGATRPLSSAVEVPETPGQPAMGGPVGGLPMESVQELGVAPYIPGAASPYLAEERGAPGPAEAPGEISFAPQQIPEAQSQLVQDEPPEQPQAQPQSQVPASLQLAGEGYRGIKQSVWAAAELERKKLEAQGGVLRQADADQALLAEAHRKEVAKDAEHVQRMTAHKLKMLDNLRGTEVKRGTIWTGKDTGEKVLAGIGVALAGLGMAMKGRGGENPALDLLLKAVDDDVALQQAEIAKMGSGIAMQSGLITDFQKQYSDAGAQRLAGMAEGMAHAKRQIEQIGLMTSVDEIANNAAMQVGELDVKIGEKVQKAEEAQPDWIWIKPRPMLQSSLRRARGCWSGFTGRSSVCLATPGMPSSCRKSKRSSWRTP